MNREKSQMIETRHQLIRDALDEWKEGGIRLLEIGIRHGETYDALHEYFDSRNVQYTGVDINFYPWIRPILGGRCLEMDSVEYWKTLPVSTLFHVIFVDGCHGEIHTEIDLKGALLHLEINGTLLMHDTGCSSTLDRPRLENAGAFGAICRSCVNRPELTARMDGSHPEGMGIVKKHASLGKQFLLDTESTNIATCCDVCEVFRSKACPSVREAFPLYFEE